MTGTRHGWLRALGVCAWLGGVATLAQLNAGPAWAQDFGSDAGLQAAKADFEEAQTLYLKEKFEDAAAKFLTAYEKKTATPFLFNAAVSFEKARKYEQAIQYFQRYLDRDPNARDSKDVAARIDGIKRLLAAPAADATGQAVPVTMLPAIDTKGLVIIETKPQGALVYLGDKKSGALTKTPWQGSLDPKPVKVIVEAKGFKAEERDINPRSDKIVELYIALSEEHFLGWVEIASNVAGADVFIDHKEIGAIGKTPYTGHVKPGKHTIWVERPGYQSTKKEVEVQPGTATTHMINLDKVALGWVAVVGKHTKGGKLTVDGKFACNTPCQAEAVPGKHKVVVEQEGKETYEADLAVEQASQTIVDIRFSDKPPKTRAWTSAVVAALFIGAGTYAGLQAKNYKEDLEKDSANPSLLVASDDPRVQKGKIYSIGADVAFGLGAITAVIATINFLSSGPPSTGETDTKSISLAPYGSPGGGGFVATGRF